MPSYGSNDTGVNTILVAGTANQASCHDEQNRLSWSSSNSASVPHGGTLTGGTLASAMESGRAGEVRNR